MILEDFALVLRRRRPWEALDLGLVIARQWRRPALAAWAATYGVAGVALSLLVLWDWRAAWLSIWWSKPLFDRVLLTVYSQAVFGASPSVRQTIGALRGSLGSSQLWADLTYRRFSPVRSFLLPIALLEGQTGRARAARGALLRRTVQNCASWLTFACASFVLLIGLSVIAALAVLAPMGVLADSWLPAHLLSAPVSVPEALLGLGLMMLCETLIEPLYVASGFSLYLNRRSELEGWDLELALRRLDHRLAPVLPTGPTGPVPERAIVSAAAPGIVLTLVVALISLLPGLGCGAAHATPAGAARAAGAGDAAPSAPSASAASSAPPAFSRAARIAGEPRPVEAPGAPIDGVDGIPERARAILRDPVFGRDAIEWTWQLRTTPQAAPAASPSTPAWLIALGRLIARLTGTLAFLLEGGVRVVLALALGAVLVLALIWGLRWSRGKRFSRAPRSRVTHVMGMDVREETLPDDVAAAARALVERGEFARALSLLYRACLVALVHRAHIAFQDGDTEGTCLDRAAGRIAPGSFAYFARLVDLWRMTAYAHRTPEEGQVSQLTALWEQYFGPNAPLVAEALGTAGAAPQ